MPRLVSALIDEVNSIFLSLYIVEKNRSNADTHRSLKSEELLDHLMPTISKLDECELVLNALSNLIFIFFKKGLKTRSDFYLPDNPSEEGLLKYIAEIIVKRLTNISSVKFVVDRAIFAEAKVSRSGNSFFVKLSDSDVGRRYLERTAFSHWLQNLQFLKVRHEAASNSVYFLGGYKLVRQVRVFGNRVKVDWCAGEELFHISRIALLLNSSERKIVINLLRKSNIFADVLKTWDFVHSISDAMQKCALDKKDQRIFSAELYRDQLISLVSDALNVSRARARRAVETLMIVKPCQDGIWSCPLVPIDNQRVAVCHPALLLNSPARLFSQLLWNLNLSSKRGDEFEAICVKTLKNLLDRAPKGQDIELLEPSHKLFRLLGRKKYQTDLIIKVGPNLVIYDAKSTSHIASER